jgi:nucleoside-diphosphate-sugar epimerase
MLGVNALGLDNNILVQIVRPATICGYSPRMRLDLSVNMITMQALTKGRITVFGGEQTRPNIHIEDMVSVYLHLLKGGSSLHGVFNAGFENLTIMDIAKLVTTQVPACIDVTDSNDPRSYRLNSDKLLATGFSPQHNVREGIRDVIEAFRSGKLKDEEGCYNIKAMKTFRLEKA